MGRVVVAIACICVLTGCSRTRSVDPTCDCASIAEMNLALSGKKAVVLLSDGTRTYPEDVQVGADSTSFRVSGASERRMSVETARISSVTITDRARGFVEGLIGGAVTSGLGFVLVGRGLENDNLALLYFGSAAVVVGPVLGLLSGMFSDSEQVYELSSESPAEGSDPGQGEDRALDAGSRKASPH